MFADERLNRVLQALTPDEQQVAYAYAYAYVYAYTEGERTTWMEAAASAGTADPVAFGERVRRKTKRMAAEQRRRTALRSGGPAAS
ncbi:hypothetical protein [Streptomyces phaeochromogenes]|uniref:hypothetical protein n=1 Tax=Streptomyces phaeochromogenes TaxID=1923 RepID=UPI0006E40A6E|nr:hypothetical protein [Streptomyces phaeochromogenes]